MNFKKPKQVSPTHLATVSTFKKLQHHIDKNSPVLFYQTQSLQPAQMTDALSKYP